MSNIHASVIAAAFGGSILLYSGLKGKNVSDTIRSVISGQDPSSLPQAAAILTPSGVDASVPGQESTGGIDATTGLPETTPNAEVDPALLPSGTKATNQAIGKLLAAPYGWATGPNWTALVNLWDRESQWSNTADNGSSGAYGIAQALPPTKYPTAGQAPPIGTSSAYYQIQWGLSYIQSRYSTPVGAWSHEESAGWY